MKMSPTAGLLWEIWRKHRQTLAAVFALAIAARLIDRFESDPGSPLIVLLAMTTFLLMFGVFNYTESAQGRGIGQFPRRLFVLPVSSLRLVAVPAAAGVIAIELLYALWHAPMSRGGAASAWFVAVLLASLMVVYLAMLWTLERAGSLRLIALGVVTMAIFVVGQLPQFPPTPPPAWRSEPVLATIVAMVAGLAFLLSWRHVDRLRGDGGRSDIRAESLFGRLAESLPSNRDAFAGPAAAQFWYEWRASGVVLPALVAAMLVLIMTISISRRDGDAFRLVTVALAAPIVLAVPIGVAFSRPSFWTQDIGVPAFVSIRPLSAEDLIAIKVKVAAVSTALSWAIVLLGVTAWVSLWGTHDTLSLLALQLWAFHEQSIAAVIAISLLALLAGMLVTWRFLVIRMWSGLAGMPALLTISALGFGSVITLAIALEIDRLPQWLFDDPARLGPLAWMMAVAVIAKYWLAVYTWRAVDPRHLRSYLMVWLGGTVLFLGAGLAAWNMIRMYVPTDVDRLRSVIVLLALLSMPLARIGLARTALSRNRHRA